MQDILTFKTNKRYKLTLVSSSSDSDELDSDSSSISLSLNFCFTEKTTHKENTWQTPLQNITVYPLKTIPLVYTVWVSHLSEKALQYLHWSRSAFSFCLWNFFAKSSFTVSFKSSMPSAILFIYAEHIFLFEPQTASIVVALFKMAERCSKRGKCFSTFFSDDLLQKCRLFSIDG